MKWVISQFGRVFLVLCPSCLLQTRITRILFCFPFAAYSFDGNNSKDEISWSFSFSSIIFSYCVVDLGSITVCGLNIDENLHECRKKMGFCPQNNCIFLHLTVNDHLWFFFNLKDGDGDWNEEANDLYEKLEMERLIERVRLFSAQFALHFHCIKPIHCFCLWS